MKHKDPSYIRLGRAIKCMVVGDMYGTVETFPSVSAAKKHSLLLQKENGGRGSGYVRVQKKGRKGNFNG